MTTRDLPDKEEPPKKRLKMSASQPTFVEKLKELIASGATDEQIERFVRTPAIQQPAPSFTVSAVLPNKEFKDISLSDYAGKWVVLFL